MIEIIKTPVGYKPDDFDERDRVFGAAPAPIILPSGDWREVRIAREYQNKKGFETYGCVTFTTLNAVEKLAKVLFNEDWNLSDRATYIASGTDPANRGNSPRKVADSVRNHGALDESELPFDDSVDTLEKFNSPRPLTYSIREKMVAWARKHGFDYDFLPTAEGIVSRETMKEALKRGRVGIAVYAWAKEGDLYVRPKGGEDTHLTSLEYVKDNGELDVFDSYDPAEKTLSKDFPIYVAMRYFLRKKTFEEQLKNTQLSLIDQLYELLKRLLKQAYNLGGEFISAIYSKRID